MVVTGILSAGENPCAVVSSYIVFQQEVCRLHNITGYLTTLLWFQLPLFPIQEIVVSIVLQQLEISDEN